MPTGFLAAARDFKAPIALVAIALVILQTLIAGLATAQAAARLVPRAIDAGVICHGADLDALADSTVPDTDKNRPVCCVFCAAGTLPLLPPHGPITAAFQLGRDCGTVTLSAHFIAIAPRAVRAGPSQAPPGLG